MNLAQLKSELTTDPAGLGLAALGDDAAAVALTAETRQIFRETVSGGLIVSSVAKSDFATLSAADKAYLQLLAVCPDIPLTAQLKTDLSALFPAGSATRTNLVAATKRTGSRADELGLGRVTASDVANARKLA